MNDNHANISASLPVFTMEMTANSRANFTHYHQYSSLYNAQLARQIESEHDYHTQADDSIKMRYISHISSSIILSAASIESKINEFIVDHLKQIKEKAKTVDINILQKLNKKIKRKEDIVQRLTIETSPICKHKLLANINMVNGIKNKNEEYLNLLIYIRNLLVHFTPEWDNDLNRHKKIQQKVKNHFTLSPFYSDDSLFFPYRCLSAKCAEWGFEITNAFIENHYK